MKRQDRFLSWPSFILPLVTRDIVGIRLLLLYLLFGNPRGLASPRFLSPFVASSIGIDVDRKDVSVCTTAYRYLATLRYATRKSAHLFFTLLEIGIYRLNIDTQQGWR